MINLDSLSQLVSGLTTENGSSLIQSVLRQTSSPIVTYIPGLDAILQNGGDLLKRGDMIEFQGLKGSGKRQIALFLIMTAILPPTITISVPLAESIEGTKDIEVNLGGKGQFVVFIDNGRRFDVSRLAIMIEAHLLFVLGQTSPDSIAMHDQIAQKIITESLERVQVDEPSSALQVVATLDNLVEWYTKQSRPELGYLFVDTEFMIEYDMIQAFLTALTRVRSILSPIVIVTNRVSSPPKISHLSQDRLPFYSSLFLSSTAWPTITLPPPLPGTSPYIGLSVAITFHPPKASKSSEAAKKKAKQDNAVYQDLLTGVIRVRGGKEIGSWEFEVTSTGIE